MKWPKLRELKEALTSLVKGPYTHPFPARPTPIPDNLRGKPEYDPEHCVGCGACAEVCPARAIEVSEAVHSDGRRVRRLVLHWDVCIFCGECERCCTTGQGIRLSSKYELSGFSRAEMVESVEKEIIACELCGRGIAPRDHLRWIQRRLGPLAWSNVTLTLFSHQELGLRAAPPRDERPLNRSDIQRLLCPACRRSVTLLDEWGPL